MLVLVPIAISLFSQVEFVQNSTCVVAELPLGLGQCEVMADLIAPAWVLAILPLANRLRSAVTAAARAPATEGEVAPIDASALALAERATRAARWGALLIVVLSYTREWERFGQRPSAEWFVLVVVATLGLLAVPVWVMRDHLHRRGAKYIDSGRLPRRVNRFLFDEEPERPARWGHVLAFCAVTLVISFTLLGQFDALLRGMHPTGHSASGASGLAGLTELDLSIKRDSVIERVGVWKEYTEAVGVDFGSARDVVAGHVMVDLALTVPSYLMAGVTLALLAWRRRLRFEAGSETRSTFERVVLVGLAVLIATVVCDLGRNFFTWYVMDRAWVDPDLLTDANVRMLWFLAAGRAAGLVVLAAAAVLLLAFGKLDTTQLRRGLMAARWEILVLLGFTVVTPTQAQVADVIRRWRVSHTLITVALAVIWSMLIRWTSVSNLRLQHSHWEQVQAGSEPEPPLLRRRQDSPTAGRAAAVAVVAVAAMQLVLAALGVPVGVGLLVPAAMVAALWLFGLILPASSYVRGDRQIERQTRRRLPRTLGSAVYLIIGLAVLRAAASSVVYARHEDWWLFFAAVPPLIGVWRILTRTTSRMGLLEALFAVVTVVLAAGLLLGGNPELSPAALSFAGITFAYGSLAYFNSYERTSLVNRLSSRFFRHEYAQPFVLLAAVSLTVFVVWFYVDPIGMGPRVGSMGMLIVAMMVFTVVGGGAARIAELTRPPRLLAAFGLKRTPFVALLLVWFLLAPAVSQATNDIRRVPSDPVSPITFDDVWNRWAGANLNPDTGQTGPGEATAEPMLLVSSSGGGLRAAVWTAFVLDCLFERAPLSDDPCGTATDESALDRVAVMSGVSGGSLGIAAFAAHTVDGGDAAEWVEEGLGDDYLAAPVGWLLFVDLPRALLGLSPADSSRAEIAERAWEASWPDPGLGRTLGSLWADTSFPPVVFNGSSVNDGCRVNVSLLDANGDSPEVPGCSSSIAPPPGSAAAFGATHDLVDFLCDDEGVALSTAAGLSARYPLVSVAGRVSANPDAECGDRAEGAIFTVDGAYLEGSGSGTLLDAWIALSGHVERYNGSGSGTCVVPFMIHIDNGYESPAVAADGAPRELLVPLLATLNAASGITMARAEAALTFEQEFAIGGQPTRVESEIGTIDSRYARLVTRAHPGVQAPLGWTLSKASIDDLRAQLATPENARAFAEIRSWLDGDLTCSSA